MMVIKPIQLSASIWSGQLEQPVKHRLDSLADQSRYPAEYLADDEDGRFRWVYFVAVVSTTRWNWLLACGASLPTSLTSWTQAWVTTRRSA